MRFVQFGLAGLMMFAVLGCGGQAEEAEKTDETKTGETAESASASDGEGDEWKIPDKFPGMKGMEEGTRPWVRAKIARNNLGMIGLASLNYDDVHGFYPYPAGSNYLPEENKGKLSWRFHLISQIERDDLYDLAKPDAPWDDEQNKALLDQMPEIFELSIETKPGYSQFVAPSGPGFIVDGAEAKAPRDIKDDPSQTILLVTVKPEHAELWTKPGGVAIDPNNAADILGGDPNGFLALFADGSTRTLDPNMDPETLKALLTIAGGEKIDPTKLPPTDFPPMKRSSTNEGVIRSHTE